MSKQLKHQQRPKTYPVRRNIFHGVEWNGQRHKLIARLCEKQLQSENAKQQITGILRQLNKSSMVDIATWADEVRNRQPKPDDDAETKKFLEDPRNQRNDTWHYVNLPLDAKEYDRQTYKKFTRDDDVVQTINSAIAVLKGEGDRFSNANALRLLVHMVGDLHQPLHVGCSYIWSPPGECPVLVIDPKFIEELNLPSDRGGNALHLPLEVEAKNDLHFFWDAGLLQSDSADSKDPEVNRRFVADVATRISNAQLKISTDLYLLTRDWATESLKVAKGAYESIEIVSLSGEGHYKVKWEGRESYVKRNAPVVKQQIALGAANLAFLLDSIWP